MEAYSRKINVKHILGKRRYSAMRHSTLFPDELRDLIIGLVAMGLAVLIWAFLMATVAL
jgi:hypothetical protein